MKFFLKILLNQIKQFDFKTYQPDSLPSSGFELNRIGVDPNKIIQFNGSKNNLNDQ